MTCLWQSNFWCALLTHSLPNWEKILTLIILSNNVSTTDMSITYLQFLELSLFPFLRKETTLATLQFPEFTCGQWRYKDLDQNTCNFLSCLFQHSGTDPSSKYISDRCTLMFLKRFNTILSISECPSIPIYLTMISLSFMSSLWWKLLQSTRIVPCRHPEEKEERNRTKGIGRNLEDIEQWNRRKG